MTMVWSDNSRHYKMSDLLDFANAPGPVAIPAYSAEDHDSYEEVYGSDSYTPEPCSGESDDGSNDIPF
jgi:hypothetical protein